MRAQWINGGQSIPAGMEGFEGHAGEFGAQIVRDDGSPVSTYFGKSEKEVADALLDAQANAAARIDELRARVKPDPAPAPRTVARREFAADDLMRIGREIQNPATAAQAIREVVEAEVGSLDAIRERSNAEAIQQTADEIRSESAAFAANTPDWFPTDHNKNLLRQYVTLQRDEQGRKWGITENNLSLAWEALKRAGLVQFAPTTTTEPTGQQPANNGAEPPTGQVQPATRPRGTVASSGLRSTDASAAGGRTEQRKKYTRADIEHMGLEEYHRLEQTDPEFKAFVASLDKPRSEATA